MKKILAALLALIAVFSLSACAPQAEDKQLSAQPPETNLSDDSQPETTAATEADPTDPAPEAGKAEIAETVLYEDDSYKVTVTGMKVDSLWGTEINLLLENNSDKNVSLSGDTFVVNGITLTGNLYVDAAAGKRANGALTLPGEALEIAGIKDIATVGTYDAHIVDTDTYDSILDIPVEIKTSIADGYTQVIDDTGDLLWQADGVTVIAQVLGDSIWGSRVQLLIKNESAENILVQADNISVNGFTVTALMSSDVVAGTVCFADMTVFESELEDNGIENIEEISFSLQILDPDSYQTIAESEELTVYSAGQ